jgi:cysteine synthase A
MNTRHPPLARSILDVIGRTPLVELTRSVESRGLSGRLLVKLEYFSPGGSKKDRIALEIIREASASGELRPGQTVVELTSGNTGTGLAVVCRALGHPFVALISRGNSVERVRQMEEFGAEVIVVEQAEGAVDGQVSGEDLALVEAKAAEIVSRRGAFRVDQFRREGNILAHERHTGPEIWAQSQGQIDVFVDMVGTCGSFTGVARFLRRLNPTVRTYAVEPAGAAVLGGGCVSNPRHRIQGAGYARTDLELFDKTLATGYIGDRRASDRRGPPPCGRGGHLRRFLNGCSSCRGLETACRAGGRGHNRISRLRQRAQVLEHGSFPLSRARLQEKRLASLSSVRQ